MIASKTEAYPSGVPI